MLAAGVETGLVVIVACAVTAAAGTFVVAACAVVVAAGTFVVADGTVVVAAVTAGTTAGLDDPDDPELAAQPSMRKPMMTKTTTATGSTSKKNSRKAR